MITEDILREAIKMNSDYMDMTNFNIYGIQEYNKIKKLGLPNKHGGIPIYNNGKKIGIVEEDIVQKIINS